MAAEPQPAFPAGDPKAELHPGVDKGVNVDPISAEVATSFELKEQMEAAERERRKKDAMQALKKTVIVSGIIAAVAGAASAITKKMREKQ